MQLEQLLHEQLHIIEQPTKQHLRQRQLQRQGVAGCGLRRQGRSGLFAEGAGQRYTESRRCGAETLFLRPGRDDDRGGRQ